MTAHYARKCRACRAEVMNRNRHGDPLGINPMGDPRLPFTPLARVLNNRARALLGPEQMAEALRVDDVTRWMADGIPFHTADRLAVSLGYHPAELWGDAYRDQPVTRCPYANLDELEGVA